MPEQFDDENPQPVMEPKVVLNCTTVMGTFSSATCVISFSSIRLETFVWPNSCSDEEYKPFRIVVSTLRRGTRDQ